MYRKVTLLALVALLVVLLVAVPAGAQSSCEIAHECPEPVQEKVLPEGSGDLMYVYAYYPPSGPYMTLSLDGLAALCYNYGGYYYLWSDGGEYWNAC